MKRVREPITTRSGSSSRGAAARGRALPPPRYGIDFVDRAAAPLQRDAATGRGAMLPPRYGIDFVDQASRRDLTPQGGHDLVNRGSGAAVQQRRAALPLSLKARTDPRSYVSAGVAPGGITTGENAAVLQMTGGAVDLHARGARIEHVQRDDPRLRAVGARSLATDGEALISDPGDRHHELWHLAQQATGRVRPDRHIGGRPVNTSPALEHEADRMGATLGQLAARASAAPHTASVGTSVGARASMSKETGYSVIQRTKDDAIEGVRQLAIDRIPENQLEELEDLIKSDHISRVIRKLVVDFGVKSTEAESIGDLYRQENFSGVAVSGGPGTTDDDVRTIRRRTKGLGLIQQHELYLRHLVDTYGARSAKIVMGDLKGAARATEKARSDRSATAVQDFIRGTIVFASSEELNKFWAKFKKERIPTERSAYNLKDRWNAKVDSGYRDYKFNHRTHAQIPTEVQLSVEQVMEVKKLEHYIYDVVRILKEKYPRAKNRPEIKAAACLSAVTIHRYEQAKRLADEGRAWTDEEIAEMKREFADGLEEFIHDRRVRNEEDALNMARTNLGKLR
ncbi:MAG: hypothetical protein R3A51_18115 [Nannocystaceae bacterium]